LSLMLAISARPALAFGPEASEWLAGRLLQVIPAKAREPLWSTEVPEFLGDRHRQEVVAPERAAILHRFDATRPRYHAAPSILDSLTGLAPFVVARATADLREAIRWDSPLRGAESLARIAQGVADLSDPFLTTPADVNETAGARAWFSDDLTSAEIDSVSVTSRAGGDPLTEALALARESAAMRPAVESAVVKGDRVAVCALRRERLERALAVGSALVERAWREARGPDQEVAPEAGLQVEPDPVRSRALLRFANAAAGEGRLELFDAAGRRVVDTPLGRIEAGAQGISIPGGQVGQLPAGLYLVRLSVGGRTFTGRFVRLAP
jgi:hypothetical protein